MLTTLHTQILIKIGYPLLINAIIGSVPPPSPNANPKKIKDHIAALCRASERFKQIRSEIFPVSTKRTGNSFAEQWSHFPEDFQNVCD